MINYLELWDQDERVKMGLSMIWEDIGPELRGKALSLCQMSFQYVDAPLTEIVEHYRGNYPQVVKLISVLSGAARRIGTTEPEDES